MNSTCIKPTPTPLHHQPYPYHKKGKKPKFKRNETKLKGIKLSILVKIETFRPGQNTKHPVT